MSHLFAGLDVSTQGCKLVVIDLDAVDVCHVEAITYDADLPEYGTRDGVIRNLGEGIAESDPKMWLEAVDRLLDNLGASAVPAGEIRCLSVSAQQHGLVALDADGNLSRPTSKLWNDFSTAEECKILTEKVGGVDAMIRAVGNSQRPGYTAGKILHFRRHEPEAYVRSATLLVVHNYINWYLTGGVAVLEPGDASGTALWNPATGEWAREVIDAIDANLMGKLPPVRPADESIGRIDPALAERFGLSHDCKIDAGSGDNMYGALGTGNVREGLVTVSLGTSGTACCFLEDPFVDPQGEIAAYCDSTGHYLPLLCVSNLANGYNEMLRLHELSHGEFDAIIKRTSPWEGGRMLIPWFGGERTPDLPWATPVYFGFTLDSMTRENLCRAVLEGHVLNLHAGFTRMPVQVEELRLTGGLSRSTAWCQAIADIFEADAVPVKGEGSALGAALHAAWVWLKEEGDAPPLQELVDPFVLLEQSRRKSPIPENVAVYRKMKDAFRGLSRRLRGLDGEDPFRLRAQAIR